MLRKTQPPHARDSTRQEPRGSVIPGRTLGPKALLRKTQPPRRGAEIFYFRPKTVTLLEDGSAAAVLRAAGAVRPVQLQQGFVASLQPDHARPRHPSQGHHLSRFDDQSR